MKNLTEFLQSQAGHIVLLAFLAFAYHAIGMDDASKACGAALLYCMSPQQASKEKDKQDEKVTQ